MIKLKGTDFHCDEASVAMQEHIFALRRLHSNQPIAKNKKMPKKSISLFFGIFVLMISPLILHC